MEVSATKKRLKLFQKGHLVWIKTQLFENAFSLWMMQTDRLKTPTFQC